MSRMLLDSENCVIIDVERSTCTKRRIQHMYLMTLSLERDTTGVNHHVLYVLIIYQKRELNG